MFFKYCGQWIVSCYVILMGVFPSSSYAVGAAEEYEIKSVYLFNLGNFIHWSEAVFSQSKTFEICILGINPFGKNLEYVIQNRQTLQKLPVVIKDNRQFTEKDSCHILFISESAKDQIATLLPALKMKAVLTVSDIDNFIEQGGMVQFFPYEGKIRLLLNLKAIETAGLKADANLVRIALKVER